MAILSNILKGIKGPKVGEKCIKLDVYAHLGYNNKNCCFKESGIEVFDLRSRTGWTQLCKQIASKR